MPYNLSLYCHLLVDTFQPHKQSRSHLSYRCSLSHSLCSLLHYTYLLAMHFLCMSPSVALLNNNPLLSYLVLYMYMSCSYLLDLLICMFLHLVIHQPNHYMHFYLYLFHQTSHLIHLDTNIHLDMQHK